MAWQQGKNRTREGGQAMVFVVLTMAVVLLITIFLYRAGKLTSEKMQIENAADASAFSVSVVEARDLNFMSYTNRAICANEVAIGQLVGLASWAAHIRSISDFLNFFNTTFLAAPTLGISTAIIEPIAAVFETVGGVLQSAVKPIAKYGVKVLYNIDKVYGLAEQGFHGVSVIFMLTTLDDTIRQNDPGASISDFGLVSLIGHILTYGALPLPGHRFTTNYSPTKADAENQTGMERLAATIRASRDPFSRERGWSIPLFPPIHQCAEIDIVVASAKGCLDIEINLEKLGGSELRYVDDSTGTHFSWSGTDVVALEAWLGVFFQLKALGVDVGSISVTLKDGTFDADVEILGGLISLDFGPFPGVPTGIPFSAGAAQAAAGAATLLQPQMLADPLGDVPLDSYGGSPKSIIAWNAVPPMPPGIVMQMPLNDVAPDYKGLPRYTDTQPDASKYGFGAPYLLIGLVKESSDINATGPQQTGQLQLDDKSADGEVAAIAKSEVYFNRAKDLSYFARADGDTEYGSAFNPYWQARLVDSSYADRLIAMLIQQKTVFLTLSGSFPLSLPHDLLSFLP
ncbi:MAG TPA: hypothetical protein VMH34_03990 [Gammaproteobacteria bacterium]|nr:hypothetical protein [Gammaproteobacteria bacterium]